MLVKWEVAKIDWDKCKGGYQGRNKQNKEIEVD